MKSLLPLFLTLAMAVSGCQPEKTQQAQAIAFTDVSVIDVRSGAVRGNQTVLIKGDRILAVGETGTISLPEEAEVINGNGKYLIPGLWDMHVHTAFPKFLTLYVANGVTGVRDTHRSSRGFEQLLAWRNEITMGSRLGPQLIISGPLVDGPHSRIDSATVVTNALEARNAVDALHAQGADFAKVYDLLSRESYFALADQAKERGLHFAGHLPLSVSAGEASDAGQRSIEHLTGLFLACSNREKPLRKRLLEAIAAADFAPRVQWRQVYTPPQEVFDAYDDKKAAALFERFRRNQTWQVPTLTVLHALSFADSPELASDHRFRYLPSDMRKGWKENTEAYKKRTRDLARRKAMFRRELELVGAMHRAGVGILAGTDLPNSWVFPGFSLHEELELLVQAGLSPLEALQAATLNPARYLEQEDEFGTVETGKRADLVLLEANPLEDIRNTRRIAAVVVAGKLLQKDRLETILTEIKSGFAN